MKPRPETWRERIDRETKERIARNLAAKERRRRMDQAKRRGAAAARTEKESL